MVIGSLYLGIGTHVNCEAALSNFKLLVEKADWYDDTFSQSFAAYKAKDYERALLGYRVLSEKGYEIAQENAAYIIDTHFHEREDLQHASKVLYNRAALQKNVDALVKTGDAFFESEEFKKAGEYYHLAALQHSAIGMYHLAHLYEHGLGFDKDLYMALRYYQDSLNVNPDAYLAVYISLVRTYTKLGMNFVQKFTVADAIASLRKLFSKTEEAVKVDKPDLEDVPLTLDAHTDEDEEVSDNEMYIVLFLAAMAAYLVYQRQGRMGGVPIIQNGQPIQQQQ